MPQYLYSNENDESDIIEVIQSIHEDHTFYIHENKKYLRVFSSPQLAFCTKIDPYNKSDYLAATEGKRETVGSLMDRSKELSEKRAAKDGIDPVKKAAYDKYAKDRKGKEHRDVTMARTREKAAKVGITISD